MITPRQGRTHKLKKFCASTHFKRFWLKKANTKLKAGDPFPFAREPASVPAFFSKLSKIQPNVLDPDPGSEC